MKIAVKPGKLRTLALLAAASALPGIGSARAQTQTVTSDITYVTLAPVTFSTIADPDFGHVRQGLAAHYVLSTAGTVTSPDGGVPEGGITHAGHYKIFGSATQQIGISAAGGYSTDGGSTTSAATCTYDAGALGVDCTGNALAPPNSGKDLLVGLTIASAGTTADGIADHPTVTITVVYQ